MSTTSAAPPIMCGAYLSQKATSSAAPALFRITALEGGSVVLEDCRTLEETMHSLDAVRDCIEADAMTIVARSTSC